MNAFSKIKHQPWFIKLSHWEYWSFNSIYYPIIFYWLYLALKARSFFFFNAANPSIAYGGFLMESKWDIAQILPPEYTPLTRIVRKAAPVSLALDMIDQFEFPIICKPDMGSRGRGVAVIRNEHELRAYYQQCPADFLMQEKIGYPMEAGIFYVRVPGEKKGRITGIVEKEFLTVTGDGFSTCRELLLKEDRYILQIAQLEMLLGTDLNKIVTKNEVHVLVPFGNHARGCRFIDSTHRASQQLTEVIDRICRMIPDFYFGRLDIRFESWEALEQGHHFSIIELNGAGSEPTHMYDENNRLWHAWKQIIVHWNWLYKVSKANHKKGHGYLTIAKGRQMFRDNTTVENQIKDFVFTPSLAVQTNEPALVL